MSRFNRNRFCGLLILASLALSGCDSEVEPQASEALPEGIELIHELPEGAIEIDPSDPASMAQLAVLRMSSLAKNGKWEQLIDSFYGEADKLTDEAQKQKLIDRFEGDWGEMLVPILEQAGTIKPTIEEGKALFKVDGQTIYELHLSDDGGWGFHL